MLALWQGRSAEISSGQAPVSKFRLGSCRRTRQRRGSLAGARRCSMHWVLVFRCAPAGARRESPTWSGRLQRQRRREAHTVPSSPQAFSHQPIRLAASLPPLRKAIESRGTATARRSQNPPAAEWGATGRPVLARAAGRRRPKPAAGSLAQWAGLRLGALLSPSLIPRLRLERSACATEIVEHGVR